MSFEKKMQKRGNDKLNQFAKNPYHQEVAPTPAPKKRFPIWATVLIPSVAVASLIVVMIPTVIAMGGNRGAQKNDSYAPANQEDSEYREADSGKGASYEPYEPSVAPGEDSKDQTSYVPHWEEATIIQKYPEFAYAGNTYTVNSTLDSQPIAETYINTKICDMTVHGYDIYEKANHSIEASLYSIKNIDLSVSLAIKFADTEEYYSYQNKNAYFANIGELKDKLSFESEVVFDTITLTEFAPNGEDTVTKYNGVTTKDITDIIFADTTIENYMRPKQRLNANDTSEGNQTSNPTEEPGSYNDCIEFSTSIPCLGIEKAAMSISKRQGFFAVNIFGNYSSYILGESVYSSLLSLLQSKGTVITQ